MTVRVRYFAILREVLNKNEEVVELDVLPQNPTIMDVFRLCVLKSHPEYEARRRHLRAALNMEFVDYDTQITDGDEIAFIPPVSGGSGPLFSADGRFGITKNQLESARVSELVQRPDAGAICTFDGVVRDHTDDREVSFLEYDAYPEMALAKIVETGENAEKRWPGVKAAVHHRWGRLEIGESAVTIAVSSPHRAEAFEACRWIIDTLKEVVPIWKKEVSPDGNEWVGWGP